MIPICKLAALDMVLHGTRFIVAEFTIGIVVPLILGFLSLRHALLRQPQIGWETAFGVWLVGIGVNYIPLLIYSVLIARANTMMAEGQPARMYVKRNGIQQLIILVPVLIVGIALVQEMYRQKEQE